MSAELPTFWEYLIVNDDGIIFGISNDAPDDEKRKYAEWMADEERLKAKGIKT